MIARPDGPRVDLHAHSTASDGSASPTELAHAAARARLSAVALTDHDTVGGLGEAVAAGREVGVEVIAGTELSAHDGRIEQHILALHVVELAHLDVALVRFRAARVRRAEEIVRLLNMLGIPLTFSDVLAQAAGGAVGRPHVARALIAARHAVDQRDAFDRFLGAGRPAYVEKEHLGMGEAIDLVHASGGIAVLAHPGRDGTRERLAPFVALGLDGLEVRHPSHTPDDAGRLAALVDEWDLVASGGSDWHGAREGPRTLGTFDIPFTWLERQRARAERWRPAPAGSPSA